jgi:hypothetical protein
MATVKIKRLKTMGLEKRSLGYQSEENNMLK